MSVPPPPSSSTFDLISSPQRYLRSRTRTSFLQQLTIAGLDASNVPPAIENASPLPSIETSPTTSLFPSYEISNVPYTPPYALGSGVQVSFPTMSPLMSATTIYPPTPPLASEFSSSPSFGRSLSRVRPVSFGLPSHREDQGSSSLAQPHYALPEENSEVPLQRGLSELSPSALRTHHRTYSSSSGSSQIGAPRDADQSASGRPSSPRLSAIVSPLRGLTSFHSSTPPSTVPRSEAAGGVVRFAVGFTLQPQSQVDNTNAPVANSFRPVVSTVPALDLREAGTQKETDIPSRPSNSGSNLTRITQADNNTIKLKDVPVVSSLGMKPQSPGTLLSRTPDLLADNLPPGIRSLFHDEAIDAAKTKEMPALNDSPSSVSLTVLSSPVISSSVTLDNAAPTLPETALPEISRGDDAEPDTITAIEGPDDASEDLTSEHLPTSLILMSLPAPSEGPVKLVVNGTFDVKGGSDHPVIVPSNKANYAISPLASDDITTKDVPSLPFPSSPPLSTFPAIEETPVDAEIAVWPPPIVKEVVPLQSTVEPLTVVTERDAGSSSIPFVPTTFEDGPHDVEASAASESRALGPLEARLPTEPVEEGSIDVSGRTEPEIDRYQIESSKLGPTSPHDGEPLISLSHARSTAVGEPRDMDADHPTSEECIPGPSPRRISDVLETPVATTYVEEASIAASRPSAPEADLLPATSERLILDSPIPWDAPVADVAETSVPSASVQRRRAVTSGPPDPADDQILLASERPVLDSLTNWGVLAADVAKAPPRSTSVEQPNAVTRGPPGPEDDLTLPVSKRAVLDTSIDWEVPVIDMVKAPPYSASGEQPRAATSGSPEPGDSLAPVASEIPVSDFLIDWEAPVIDVPEAPVPNASVERRRAVATEGPGPEDDLVSVTPKRPILDFLTDWEASVPSASVEQPGAVTTKGLEPEDRSIPVTPENAVLDTPTPWDAPVTDVAETPPPSASDKQPRTVMPRPPEAEDDLTAVASDGPILGPLIAWEAPVIDTAKAPPSSASGEQPRAVTSGPPGPEDALIPTASEGPMFAPLIDWEAPVIDVAKAPPSGTSGEQPRAVTSGPEPEDAPASAAFERPALDIPAYWNTDGTNVVQDPQLSASNAPVEKSGVVLSGPLDPEDNLDRTASNRQVSKISYPLDPQVIHVVDALASSVCSGDDTITTVCPPSAVDDSTQADTKEQVRRKTKTRPAPGIDRFNVFASKALESLTSYDPHRPSISPTGNPLSGQTDERPPGQPTNPFPASTPSTRTSPKGDPSGIDEATSIVPNIVITPPSTEALEQGPKTSPSFTDPQPSPPEIPNLTGRIDRLGLTPIATGGYSSVWRGRLLSATSDDPDRAFQVAIKVLRASYTDEYTLKQKLHKRLRVEMRVWAQLRHENVVGLLGHTEEPEGPGFVSVLYPHGNVLSFLAKNPGVNREIICADVALGLQYLHEHDPPIIHGDLKGPNVLIDGEGRASICDFGLSIILDGEPTGHTTSNFGGSLRFLAPELLEESSRTVQTDIYTYACTCIEILFDQQPYHEVSKEVHLMRAISDRRPPIEPPNEDVTFPSLWLILKRCWDHDRSRRPPLNLVIKTIQRCLYRSDRTNLAVHQGIGRRVRLMCLPGIEQGTLISVVDDGLSVVVNSSDSFHRVPIYQRYRWEFMDRQNLEDSEDESDVSWPHGAAHQHSSLFSLLGKFAPSSESPAYVSKWRDYSAKFRFPYSSRVSYEPYNEATS